MADAILDAPRFKSETAARKHLEAIRWPSGPICPHCGGTERNSALNGDAHRPGLYFCGDCRSQFTVTVGTVFEDSKIPLHKWVLATHLLCASKKGMSSKQLERMLGVTYKTAWFTRNEGPATSTRSLPWSSATAKREASTSRTSPLRASSRSCSGRFAKART